ncbi:MAG: ribosome maturation factor RimP [Candidatus Eisenbacteria bacterium]|uniref:Ribosome maturation factor RimP n=1 Tax=Eiseniibacteriota bacterium TaxID=2212470 RepID=A0A956RP62_UNCEI|nr:ribosome maturation factor RimP [Candidatus Eisenbacteria bacterium]
MTKEQLAELVQPLVFAEGYELVECSVSRRPRGQTFRVSIDREEGVTVAACAEVSRRIAQILEDNPLTSGGFDIEVSSPGMNRPVWTLEHYRRFRGEGVKVQLRNPSEGTTMTTLIGEIGDVEDDGFWLLREGSDSLRLRLDEIESAHLRMDPWKRRPGRNPGSR